MAFLVREDGTYASHADTGRVGALMSEDFPAEVVVRVLHATDGAVVDAATGNLIGFASVPAAFTTAVVAVNEAVVSAPMLRIERTALVQLAVSLVLIDVAIGVAVWVMFRPIQGAATVLRSVAAGDARPALR